MKNKRKSNGRKWLRLTYLLLPFISAVNMILPSLLRYIINKAFYKIRGCRGQIDSLRISFINSSIHATGLYLDTIDPSINEWVTFFAAKTIEIDFDRASLWSGTIRISIYIDGPSVTLIKGIDINLPSTDFDVPVVLDGCRIVNGKLVFIDESVSPHLRLEATKIEISGEQIMQQETPDLLTFVAQVAASVYGGHLGATVKTDLQSPQPAFDLNAEVKGVNLPALNDFFKAYGHFTVHKGTLEVFSEVAAVDGKFKGYVKPFVEKLEFIGPEDKRESITGILWEGLLGTINEIFKNHSQDEIATKIPIRGTFKNTKINVWFAVLETLKNGFISALCVCLDHEININSIKKT